jgi:protein gp37
VAENSKIEWTDHTFNPWIGCQKVSPGCDRCYAESLATRYGWTTWGPHGERKRTSDATWRKPRQWAKAARGSGKRPRVFCASLADVFDNQADANWRRDLFLLIHETPELDWLLLTKRPENLHRMFPTGEWPNVWLGTTCEDQERADRRIPLLLEQKRVGRHFLSCEPLISEITFEPEHLLGLDWIVVGGETGRGARMMQSWWAEHIKAQCEAAGVWFFMKQMTDKKPIPPHLLVREFPTAHRGI